MKKEEDIYIYTEERKPLFIYLGPNPNNLAQHPIRLYAITATQGAGHALLRLRNSLRSNKQRDQPQEQCAVFMYREHCSDEDEGREAR